MKSVGSGAIFHRAPGEPACLAIHLKWRQADCMSFLHGFLVAFPSFKLMGFRDKDAPASWLLPYMRAQLTYERLGKRTSQPAILSTTLLKDNYHINTKNFVPPSIVC